jgi:hypothetical protein
MITPDQIAHKAGQKFRAFLIAWLTDQPFFPLHFPVGQIVMTDWDNYRQTLQSLKAGDGRYYQIEWVTRRTRDFGEQTQPKRVTIPDAKAYLALTRRVRAFEQFTRGVAASRAALPELEPWIAAHPFALIQFANQWDDLLQVCQYFIAHPNSNLYIRELPIPVHTKFIEKHAGVLRSMLDALLPPEAFDAGERHFARRYGLRYDEPLIRARLLDTRVNGLPFTDFSVPLSHLAAWDGAPSRCLIVENRMTFLTLPPLIDTLALWGGGYRVELLKGLSWLKSRTIFYWGDIDAHGFHILSMLRHALPDVRSLLMDETTFNAHAAYLVADTLTPLLENPHLTEDEQALYARVQRDRLRLEQEHIPQLYITARLCETFV